MKVIQQTDEKIGLRGYGFDNNALLMGAGDAASFAHYGLTIYLRYGEISKIVSHLYDRKVDIEYYKGDNQNQHKGNQNQATEVENLDFFKQMFIPKGMDSYCLYENGDFPIFKKCITSVHIWESKCSNKEIGKYHLSFQINPSEILLEILSPNLKDRIIPWNDVRWELLDETRNYNTGMVGLSFHIF